MGELYILYDNSPKARKWTELHSHSRLRYISIYKQELFPKRIIQRQCHSSPNYRLRFVHEYFIMLLFNSYAPASVSKLISRAMFQWIPNTRAVWTTCGIAPRIFTPVRPRIDSFKFNAAIRDGLEYAEIAENNHLIVAPIKWYKKSSVSASTSLIARLVVCRPFKFTSTSRAKRNFSPRK